MRTIIDIKLVNHKHQRYDTIGDWKFSVRRGYSDPYSAGEQEALMSTMTREEIKKEEQLTIKISDLGDEKMNACIAIHELIEALLCRFNDPEITTEMVDQFDIKEWPLMYQCNLKEPGDSPVAPYHLQHMFASRIERAFAERLGVNWEEYERRIEEL